MTISKLSKLGGGRIPIYNKENIVPTNFLMKYSKIKMGINTFKMSFENFPFKI